MGLSINVAVSMIECIKNKNYKSVLCLGKQSFGYNVGYLINSKKKYNHKTNLEVFDILDKNSMLNQALFFKTLGFNQIDTLDIDHYEGANIIFDLNEKISNDLIDKYDLIYDGGTLEHVFNIGNALINLSRMLKINGMVFHANPCNGYIDHGFFQISPTFYFDYYIQNNFKIIHSAIVEKSVGIKSFFVNQDLYRTFDKDFGVKYTPKGVINFCAKKIKNENNFSVPQQGFYLSKWKNDNQHKHEIEKKFILVDYHLAHKMFKLWNIIPNFIIRKIKFIKRMKFKLF